MAGEDRVSEKGHEPPVDDIRKITVALNLATGEIAVTGISNGAVVNIGMLEYALMLVKRSDLEAQMKAAAQRPRIVEVPSGKFQ